MNWFQHCSNEAEIKTAYRIYAKQLHPDVGGDTATMQEINAQYESALKGDYARQGFDAEKTAARWDLDKEIMQKAQEILKIKAEINLEVCGVWLWITGETKTVKEELKALACRWSPKKLAWYYRREVDGGMHRYRRHLTLEQIRMKYGSAGIGQKPEDQRCIA